MSNTTKAELENLSDEKLRAILLTADGRGKEAKELSLDILLHRRFPSKVKDVPAAFYREEPEDAAEKEKAGTGSIESAICGNCEKPLSAHYREKENYCFENTSGDVFTDQPSSRALLSWLESRNGTFYASLVADWQREHGHKP